MPRNTAKLIIEKIEALAHDPFAPNNNVRKLTNHPGKVTKEKGDSPGGTVSSRALYPR